MMQNAAGFHYQNYSRRASAVLVRAVLPAMVSLAAEARADSFYPFPDSSVHISAAVLAAAADVPMTAGPVYNVLGDPSSIQVVNFGTTIYTGPIDVSTTIARLRNNQSVYKSESDDGGFFNFNTGELPNIPRMGMNYYMEFMVWPVMNLSAGTFDRTAIPYSSTNTTGTPDNFPGPERIIVGSAGEVYYTGDHYSTSNYVSPVAPQRQLTVNSWNITSGSWSSASSWSTAQVPVAGDRAFLSVKDTSSTARVVNYDYTGAAVTLGDMLVNADGTQTSHGSMQFQQSQGTLTARTEEVWARYSTASVIQSGGTTSVLGAIHIGSLVASVGAYNLSGGTLSAASEYIGSTELIASAGTGSFNQTGGTHTVTGAVNLGFSNGGTGVYTLQAGTLNAGAINVNPGGTFNQTGGTLNLSTSIVNGATAMLGGTQNYSSGATFINKAGATATFVTDAGALATNLNLNVSGGVVNFNTSQHLASLTIGGGTVQVNRNGSSASALITSQLPINSGQLNLTSNGLDLPGGSLGSVRSMVALAFNNGTWTGPGVTSSTAASDSTHLTALGIIQNNQSGTALFTGNKPFEGVIPGVSDILVKYTYYGDSNLSGKVDGSDYSLIDSGYTNHATGWYNGDFNYDGVVNGSDYTLIDNAFNTQGALLTAEGTPIAGVVNEIAVPEPVCASSAVIATWGFLRRRLRR